MMVSPLIETFFDPATFTYSYVIAAGGRAAIIDPVLDYEPATGMTSTESADQILDYVERNLLQVEWILETHVHADHLTAAAYLQSDLEIKVLHPPLTQDTTLYICHDYGSETRTEFRNETTVAFERQFNIRAGELPPAESNGVHYLKIPVKAS